MIRFDSFVQKRQLKFFLPFVLSLLFIGLAACGSEDSGEEQVSGVEELEAKYQALLDQPADGKQMDQVWSTMKELAAAYYQRGATDGGSADGPEDMYRAADLYSASFEYGEAVKIYDQIIDQHTDHKRAADALFAKGFIFNDKIGDTAQARAAYSQFLRQYPDHQMVQAAQTEIQLLGVPAEEWLKRIEAADSAAQK